MIIVYYVVTQSGFYMCTCDLKLGVGGEGSIVDNVALGAGVGGEYGGEAGLLGGEASPPSSPQ